MSGSPYRSAAWCPLPGPAPEPDEQRWLRQEAERLAQREGEHFGDDLSDATFMFVWLVETGRREP